MPTPAPFESPSKPPPNGALTPQILSPKASLGSIPFDRFNPPSSLPHAALRSELPKSTRRSSTLLPNNIPGGLLNFTRFETDQIHLCVAFIQELISQSAALNRVSIAEMQRSVKIMATGGGAHKFYEMFKAELGDEVEVMREDEMECLITGLGFITSIPNEVFWYSDELVYKVSHLSFPDTPAEGSPASSAAASDAGPPPLSSSSSSSSFTSALPPPQVELPRPSPNPPLYEVTFDTNPMAQSRFPCLLVNIGSGVSIVKVDKDGVFERVSGTSLGGGTLWGLLSLLTDAESFDGQFTNVS